VRDLRVAYSSSENPGDVLLADDVGETLRSEPPVESLVGSFLILGHLTSLEAASEVRLSSRPDPLAAFVRTGVGCDGQAVYGTRSVPLRAAAVRP
jgi:hypothetical protein